MSALNVFLRHDRAWMQADASLYDQQGNIIAFGPKIVTLSNLRAAISARGLQGVAPLLGPNLSWQFATFDDMIAQGGLIVRNIYRDFVRSYVPGNAAEKDIELVVLGWSEKENRPRCYTLFSEGLSAAAGVEPYTFTPTSEDTEDWFVSPDLDAEGWIRLGRQGIELGKNGFTTAHFDPAKHGTVYMEEQRQRRVDFEQNKQISIVGGFLASVEISREGISEKILHRWEDKIGEPIQPEPRPAFENVTPLKMNRHERRAAAKRSIYA